MTGMVIIVDKTSPRCDECRAILKYGHLMTCSLWTEESDKAGTIRIQEDIENG